MNIYFGQIYAEVNTNFPFSHLFQKYLSEKITSLVFPSQKFLKDYGDDWDLKIRISAKKNLKNNLIKGPTIFKKDKSVEFTVFLPFEVITSNKEWLKSSVAYLFEGIKDVLEMLEFSTEKLLKEYIQISDHIYTNPTMLKVNKGPTI